MLDSRVMFRGFRTLTLLGSALLFLLPALLPACVVNLADVNGAKANGSITGPAADCSLTPVVGEGGPGATPAIKYVGRYDMSDPAHPHFDWSGNIMNARFHGTQVSWSADSATEIIYELVVDGVDTAVTLGGRTVDNAALDQTDSAGHAINIAKNVVTVTVPEGDHEISVIRSSEALFSECSYVPFTFGGSTQLLPPVEHPRRIEYIGDSITCGYGILGDNATCPYDVAIYTVTAGDGTVTTVTVPKSENVYLAYGSLAARRLAADATTLCFSGKGVSVNYREQGVGEGKVINMNDQADPDARTVIPDYYLRTIATESPAVICAKNETCASGRCVEGMCRCTTDAECGGMGKCEAPPPNALGDNTCHNPKYQPWDFTKDLPIPQVVFINLGTNDFSRDVDQNSVADGIDLPKFQAAYSNFVDFVRSKRPDAQIILAVPPMVTDKFPLDNARTDLKNTLDAIVAARLAAGDTKIYEMELVQMGVRYGLGCDYHPNQEVHRIMADQVVGAIQSKTCWSEVSPR